MNRWSTWAERLRRRHSRRERDGVSRTMALVRRAGSVTYLRIANRRTMIHLHASLGAISRPSPSMFVRCVTARGLSSIGALRRQGTMPTTRAVLAASGAAINGSERSPLVDTPPAFVRVPEVLAQRARSRRGERRGEERPDTRTVPTQVLAAPRGRLAVNGTHVDLSMRLRQRAVRQELPIPNRTTVLARHASSAGAASPQHEAIEREHVAPMRAEWTAPVPVPAINVEALTSQVIQQLDRRLLAYRERMGRV